MNTNFATVIGAVAIERLEDRRLLSALISGQTVQDTIPLGQAHSYTLDAVAGGSLSVAMAETSSSLFSPVIEVFSPDNVLLETAGGSVGAGLDLFDLPQSGTYTIVARDAGDDHGGAYALTAVRTPGDQFVDADSGPITTGEYHTGTLRRGDLDVFTFDANAGESIAVSLGEYGNSATFFAPQLHLFAPDGALLSSGSGASGARVDAVGLPQSGTYTVLVREQGNNDIGNYGLTMVRVPANQPVDDDSGPIASGQRLTGTIDPGDLDVYTFSASSGDSIAVVLGDSAQSTYSPALHVYAPDGTLVGSGTSQIGTAVDAIDLPQSGTYFIVVGDADSTEQFEAEYHLSLAVLGFGGAAAQPDTLDNDGSALTSGQSISGAITLGDLDLYTLDLAASQNVTIQIADLSATNFFAPRIDLFAPDGALIDSQSGNAGATIDVLGAPQAGTYFLIVRDAGEDQPGNYSLGIDVAPGPDARPPEVTQARLDVDASNQRLVFVMNESIAGSLASADLTLENRTVGTTVPSGDIYAEFNTTSNEIHFQFFVFPDAVLPDGHYRATLPAGSAVDRAGNPLPDDVVFEFSFLQGDANRDGRVNLDDFNILAGNFGRFGLDFTDGNFDYDLHGNVNLDDFNRLADQFGKTLPAPATSTDLGRGWTFGAGLHIGDAGTNEDEKRLTDLG